MPNLAVSWRVILLAMLAGLLLAGTAGCGIGAETGDSAVAWVQSWDAALDRAQNENKPVMINFYADFCPACRRLDSETYTNEGLGAFLNQNVVPLKSNASISALHQNFDIENTVPTIVFASPDGTEIGRFVSYRNPVEFRQLTEAILSQWES
jgi:thiol:disulfide interchange protein